MNSVPHRRGPAEIYGHGFYDAATKLRRYRNSKAETPHHLFDHEPILAAEDFNRTYFEARTFVAKSGHSDIDRRLSTLRHGGIYDFADHFDCPTVEFGNSLRSRHSGVRSSAGFTARREGSKLLIDGTVRHGLYTTADHGRASRGSAAALARGTVRIRGPYHRRQNVAAESCYQTSGELTVVRVTWGDVY